MSDTTLDTEQAIATIIANAGESRSCSMAAMESARAGRFEEAAALLADGDKAQKIAHDLHTSLLVAEARGEGAPVTLLLVHASSHLSVAEMTRETAALYIELVQERNTHRA
jgi:cellobiose PTS system EIIA component